MKVLIVSDTHGKQELFKKVFEKEQPDRVIHCGDSEGYELELDMICGDKQLDIVAGNCDWSNLPGMLVISICGVRIVVVHGHMQRANYGNFGLAETARGNDASVIFYGHTHVPDISYNGGITIVNPGSLTKPRQENRRPTYAIMMVNSKGDATFEIKYADF